MVELRALRLNCVFQAHGDLWNRCWRVGYMDDTWASVPSSGVPLLIDAAEWNRFVPLRIAEARRQALLEVDVLIALALEVSIDDLCTVYRTQFPVLYGYDRKRDHYDANGRLVQTRLSFAGASGATT